MPAKAVLLFEDETILRLFPVARRAWSLPGEAAPIAITGNNAKRVLYGTINIRTGHRILMRYQNMKQAGFHAFLHVLRRCYGHRQVWLVLDGASSHTSARSQALAEQLDIKLIWLPKQCAELNGMDHFWRAVKGNISANYQFTGINEHVSYAEWYSLQLTNNQALRKAGIMSRNFWLKAFLK
jgi:hypothetical protein